MRQHEPTWDTGVPSRILEHKSNYMRFRKRQTGPWREKSGEWGFWLALLEELWILGS